MVTNVFVPPYPGLPLNLLNPARANVGDDQGTNVNQMDNVITIANIHKETKARQGTK